MISWERILYVDLLAKHLKEQEMIAKDQAIAMRAKTKGR
jgi:hypothetical protein